MAHTATDNCDTSEATLTIRQQRGAQRLDLTTPDWRSKVDPNTLSLKSMQDCVLGQVYGHYLKGLDEINLYIGKQHGFAVVCGYCRDYLTQLWKEEVTRYDKDR